MGFIMWQDKGRSGYGDSTLQGDYDSWDGISPNGRQYKNEITQEVRNLSGFRYWDMRKQNSPEQVIPESLHMLNKNRANIAAYADPVPTKRTTKVPLKQRILPQSARVDKLRSEAIELEAAFKAGEFSADEYTLLRDVAFKKLRRAEELLKKAITPVMKAEETDEDYAQVQAEYTPSSGFSAQDDGGYGLEEFEAVGVRFIDELSSNNSFKKPLKIACTLIKTAVHLSHKARSYWNELKAV